MATLTDSLKKFLDNKAASARLDLTLKDGFLPQLITVENGDFKEVDIDFEETSKIEVSSVIREQCATNPAIDALAMIFCAYTVVQDLTSNKEIADDLRNEDGLIESIMVYLYTKEKSSYRRIPYIKKPDGGYWFGDEGWKDVTGKLTGMFANPFMV